MYVCMYASIAKATTDALYTLSVLEITVKFIYAISGNNVFYNPKYTHGMLNVSLGFPFGKAYTLRRIYGIVYRGNYIQGSTYSGLYSTQRG